MRTLGAHPGLRRIWLFLGRCGLLFFVLAPGSLGLAEVSPEVESLKAKLANLGEEAKVPLLNDLAERTAESSPVESFEFGRQALALAEKFKLAWEAVRAREALGAALHHQKQYAEAKSLLDQNLPLLRAFRSSPRGGVSDKTVKEALARGLETRGSLANDSNEYETGVRMSLEAQALYRELGLMAKVSSTGRAAGMSHFFMSRLDQALAFFLDALDTADQAGAVDEMAICSYMIGYINRDLENYDKAFEYFQKCEPLARKSGNRKYVVFSLNEMGNALMLKKEFDKARLYKDRALQEARAWGDPYVLATCLNDLGFFYHLQKKYDLALRYYDEAMAVDVKPPRVRDTAVIVVNKAEIHLARREYARAVRLVLETLPAAEKAGLRREALNLSQVLKDAYVGLGDYPQAMETYDRVSRLREEILNEEKTKQIAEMQTRFETNKKEQENASLRKQNALKEQTLRNSRYLRNALIAITGLVLLLVGLVYSRYRLKVRANRKLESANEEIRQKRDELSDAYITMEELARTDTLTGLSNRRDMLDKLEQERVRFERNRQPFTVAMIDLDRFKAVNDRNGHDCGDALLKSVASLLRSSVRAQDQVGRWGGDEFLILFPETGRTGGRTIMEAIQERVAETDFALTGRSLRTELSWGLSEFREGLTLDDCLRESDIALYENKKRKRPEAIPPS